MTKLLPALGLASVLLAQTAVDEKTFARIRSEEAEHSQIMATMHMLTDRYGPRLTGSPNHEAAAKWVVKQLTAWGFQNAKLEPWDFGHPGWLNEHAFAYIMAPVHENLKFEVLAWTPSTKGTVEASAVEIVVPRGPEIPPAAEGEGRGGRGGRGGPQFQQPTQAELTQWMEANKAKVKGKIVLVGKAAVIPVNFDPPAMRRDDAQVKESYDPNNPNGGRGGRGRGAGGPGHARSKPADREPGYGACGWLPGSEWCAAPAERRGYGPWLDPRLQQSYLRRKEGAPDPGASQRRLRTDRAPAGGWRRRQAGVQYREPLYPEGKTSTT